MTQSLEQAITREFVGDLPPEPLLPPIAGRLGRPDLTIDDVVSVLVHPDATAARARARTALHRWDAETVDPWAMDTTSGTVERRHDVYARLGIPVEGFEALDAEFPRAGVPLVIADPAVWEPWYTTGRRAAHDFYWRAYRGVLSRSWTPDAIDTLDTATTSIVARLADPERDEPYQSKGLVVGYVQSGKTANFAGVLAKAMDAGYRLVIVLTGTIELLRSQTQRRLDMQLIGVQNIGADTDYLDDDGWRNGEFLTHELDPNTTNDVPAIRRLTGAAFDFKALGKGISTLNYEYLDHTLPLNNPKNLHNSNIRIAVVKKNSTVLAKLVADLATSSERIAQVPALIIDDEADQASVNTVAPTTGSDSASKERTAINRRIAELLRLLPRCQYIGYTATPFANVFVDPIDTEDIFPRDFIVSLPRPDGYMGGADFHDSPDDADAGSERTPANSEELAHVRDLLSAHDDAGRTAEQRRALDSFVLSGAVKLWREDRGVGTFRHHTMLVHQSVKVAEHEALADEFRGLWSGGGYTQATALRRLEQLWATDFAPVSAARAEPGVPTPATFADLVPFVGAAHDRISTGLSPVIVVNGAAEKDYVQDSLDFQAGGVWKILVGGAKLSRGFTVEGLTITYYSRRTAMADSLMQMGRWFGFRPGYRDLVRLFIARNVPGPGGKEFDMYDAFASIVADEEDFRTELERFAGVNENGEPFVTPMDVPPLVFQTRPWLTPTARNKMFNAELTYRGVGGSAFSFTMQPPRTEGVNRDHFAAVRPLLEALTEVDTFVLTDKDDKARPFEARVGVVPATTVLEAVSAFTWDPRWDFTPHRAALERAIASGKLADFAVLLPIPKTRPSVPVRGWDRFDLPLVNRKRQDDGYRSGFSGTAVRERDAIERIAGKVGSGVPDPAASRRHTPTRGGLILVFANDPSTRNKKRVTTGPIDPQDIATLFSYALPLAAEPTPRVGFRTRKAGGGAIVDAR